MLGGKQIDVIAKRFNDSIPITAADFYVNSKVGHLTIPNIYPDLHNYFPPVLDQLLANKPFQEYKNKITSSDLVIVSRCKDKKAALAYYKN